MRSIFLILVFFATIKISAQAFNVGDTTCNYKKVNYNFSPIACNAWQLGAKAYTIDVNSDGNFDVEVWSNCFYDPGSGGSASDMKSIFITSGSSYQAGFGPSILTPCSSSMVRSYSVGTVIDNSINWGALPMFSGVNNSAACYRLYNDLLNTSNSTLCGLQTNSFYAVFRKATPTDTVYGWLLIDTNWPGKLISYAYKKVPLISGAVFTNTNTTICQGATLNLTANPSSGVFNGPGVIGNNFNSGTMSPGNYPVYYNNGCVNAATLNVTVNALPTSVFTNTTSNLCPSDTLILTGAPSGGVFTGSGVAGNVFHSSITGYGTFPVYYTYTNGGGCSKTATMNIAIAAPTISVNSSYPFSCSGQSVTLTANGASSYTWSGGQTTSTVVLSPTTSTTYSVIGISSLGCTNTAVFNQVIGNPTISITASSTSSLLCPGQTVTITANGAVTYSWNTGASSQNLIVSPTSNTSYTVVGALTGAGGCSNTAVFNQTVGSPTVSAFTPSASICKFDAVTLTSSGAAANYLWSNGATTKTCVVSPTTTTTYSLIATNPGGCSDTAFVAQIVAPTLSITTVSSQSIVCVGDSVILTMSGATYYNGFSNIQPIGFIVWTNTVTITPSVTDTYTIIGMSSINGCDAEGYFTQVVSPCIGINEIFLQEEFFIIFPNPNNGEFEIKGKKEETIFISNELGQTLQSKQLNSQNNYSQKISELENGIYFVGNSSRLQKIVVIR